MSLFSLWTFRCSCRAASALGLLLLLGSSARGETFDQYGLIATFSLPANSGPFDALPDGRLVTLIDDHLYIEDSAGTATFTLLGALPGADLPSFGAAFLCVSPSGSRIAVGNNGGASFGNYQVGVFDFPTLTGTWFTAEHFDAAWIDDILLAITAGTFGSPAYVSVLDTTSPVPANPVNTTVVDGIGGASAGVALDSQGNLFTGNGFFFTGPSDTGAIRAFHAAEWNAVLTGAPPLDFELEGDAIVELLSASPLHFDSSGNLVVGGGDSAQGDENYAALVRASAIGAALSGGPAIDPNSPANVRRLDPDNTAVNFYTVAYNPALGEIYLRDFGSSTVFVYGADQATVPAASTWGLLVLSLSVLCGATVAIERRAAPMPVAAKATFGTRRSLRVLLTAGLPGLIAGPVTADPFASAVVDYQPAPGQFVNDPFFNDPSAALGPPSGGGLYDPDNSSVVSLGGFGGHLVLRFDQVVENHPLNPLGLDGIVFSNAFYFSSNQAVRWSEPATIEIALDADGSGLIEEDRGEHWYLIPGSLIHDPSALHHSVTWDDDAGTSAPPALLSWIPAGLSGTWATSGFALAEELFDSVLVANPSSDPAFEGIWGYGGHTPTLLLGDSNANDVVDEPAADPESFYTAPDDPHLAGISPGSAGGDAFDIAWAVNPVNGEPADLPGFDFIRLTCAVDVVLSPFGEKSPEIDAVADVRADFTGNCNGDTRIDLFDAGCLQRCLGEAPVDADCEFMDADRSGMIGLADWPIISDRLEGTS